jgi:hypothetical protein
MHDNCALPLLAGESWGGVRSWLLKINRVTPSQPPPACRGRSKSKHARELRSLPYMQEEKHCVKSGSACKA